MKLFIITEEEIERGNDAITNVNGEFNGCFDPMLETKPLTLCQDCKKWKTMNCKRAISKDHNFMSDGYHYSEPGWRATDPDDFCKDGEPKEIV